MSKRSEEPEISMPRRKPSKSPYESFPVSELKGISFRFEDDVYEYAWLLLRLDDAKGKGTNSTHRHTLYGLARHYASLADLPESQVLTEFKRRKLPLRACVDFDSKSVPAINAAAQSQVELGGEKS